MLAEAQELCERQREQDRKVVNDQQQAAILSLANSFPNVWRDPATPDRERKRLVRLLLDDVTLIRADNITLRLRFRGGAHRTIQLPLPLRSWEQRQTSKTVVAEIDRLLDLHTYPEVAAKLNESGMSSGEGKPFTARSVAGIQRRYRLKSRSERLRAAGLLTLREIAAVLDLSTTRVKIWLRHGLLRAHAYNNSNACLYELPGSNPPRKAQGVRYSKRLSVKQVVIARTEEVQCEA